MSGPTSLYTGYLAHPGLFSLPSDSVVPGQRQKAIDCICGALEAIDPESVNLFEDFGVGCTAGSVHARLPVLLGRLSATHTNAGVSQYNHVNLPGYAGLKLVNPNRVTQLVSVLVYSRHKERGDSNPTGVFQGCLVRELIPHGAVTIDPSDVPHDNVGGILDKPYRRYAEAIWTPVEEVVIREGQQERRTRIANGLGGAFYGGSNRRSLLAHPSRFSLPSDRVVPGQRQKAIDCICDGVIAIDPEHQDVFEEFGINCGE
jgi:hypothetical protein